MSSEAISVRAISKSFVRGRPVLKNVSIDVRRGEMVALIGASGSGKSTLIRSIGGLERIDPVKGSAILVCGEFVQKDGRISPSLGHLRSRIGIVFQQFNLVPRLSALTNVCLGFLGVTSPFLGSLGLFTHAQKKAAMRALSRVGVAEHALKSGNQLSGGQQQRVAIARTMVQKSEIIIADEPIASLDPGSARRVMDILSDVNQQDGVTIVVSLHQVEYAIEYCPRTIALRSGEIVFDGPSNALTPQFLAELYGEESESLFLPGMAARNSRAPVQVTAAAAAAHVNAAASLVQVAHA